MIKLRLHGEAEEVDRIARLLRELAVDGDIRDPQRVRQL